MDQTKMGNLIRQMRKKAGLTQLALAEKLCVSDKAVSKWERGLGMPDVSIFPALAEVFHVKVESLLAGELEENEMSNGNLKKMKFYICPECGNLLFTTDEADISCCGRTLAPLTAQKAADEQKLHAEPMETEWYITADHEMIREHYISFVAFVNGDTMILRKLYPEWNMETRLPRLAHGMLVWYCTQHVLFYQLL